MLIYKIGNVVMNEKVRINKYLSSAGVCSRREADKLIADGKVYIDGVCAGLGDTVSPEQTVTVNGKKVGDKAEERVYYLCNKPRGIVCTAEKREKNNIIEYFHLPERVFYAGRLDKDSEGLVFLTNDGDVVNKMMRAANYHEKEYEVSVDKPVTQEFLDKLSAGVYLEELDCTTRPCRVRKLAERKINIILTQGLNRQIRRMCEATEFRVQKLVRTRIMNMELGNLKAGEYRKVSDAELKELFRRLESSSNQPAKERRR